ncbi:MAG: hypothetical protein JZU65_00680 [Chlorobium sp.]|jgi:hypothetical protein|nr:hypothetical protein [Chlorobium sp.]
MIASSILNSVTFKNLSGSYPNMWNRLHATRKQGNARVIPYAQKFQKDHVLYLQLESDIADAITLKSYCGTVEIESFTVAYESHYGTTDNRYYTNFTVTLDADYYEKQVYFKATQGANTLTSEPIFITDLTGLINRGIMKYVKYTNLDRIESDLDSRFIDWSVLPSTGNYLDFFIEAIDSEPNDKDESEVLEGSQSKTILSASFYSGRVLKTGAIPDYLATKLGMVTSLDVFTVNEIEYVKSGDVEQSPFGGSTLYQCSIKLTQKNAIGINVDNIGATEGGTTPPIAGTPMYLGSVTSAAPAEAEVKLIASVTASKTNQTKVYTIADARFCFAYPASFGALTSILDTIGDEIISGFNIQTLNFTIGADTISFKVYTLKSLTSVTGYTVQFKF